MASRRAERVNFFSGGELMKGERVEDVTVVDISLNGVLVAMPESTIDWVAGERANLTVKLNDTGLVMSFSGKVQRSEGPFVGIEFDDMDLDSATHLRRLLELNTGQPAMAERSFADLTD